MLKKLTHYWRIWLLFRRLQLMRTVEYRGNFFFWTFVSLMWSGFNFFFFYLLTNVTGNLGGWSTSDVTILIAVFTIFDGLMWSYFYQNMKLYTQAIFSGDFNLLLLKPVDTQFLAMNQTNTFDGLFRIVLGSVVLVSALSAAGYHPSILQISLCLVAFGCSLVFISASWFIISTLAFWVEKLDNINEVIPSMRRIWQIPRQVFIGFLSTLLTIVFPMALVTSLPSEWLINRGQLSWLGFYLLFTFLTVLFSRWFFHFSVKKYSGIAS